ncbi:hypothetical protein Vi05172_g7607 [Venturia inaequalis]|nr:hypothetical protein Vi05172_g7607 [Venturia inaequalis]
MADKHPAFSSKDSNQSQGKPQVIGRDASGQPTYPPRPSSGTSSGNPPFYTSFQANSSLGASQQQQASREGQVSQHHPLPGQEQSSNAQQPGVSRQASLTSNSAVQTSAETLNVQLAIDKLQKWWNAPGIDDFTPYPKNQGRKEKAVNNRYTAPGPMPERVCYILPSDASRTSLHLTRGWTDSDCSPRNMVHLYRSGYDTAAIAAGTDRRTRSKFKDYQRTLHMRAMRWCYGNGVIGGSLPNQVLSPKYVLPLLKLSTAQLFFGVIGDLVVEDFPNGIYNMTPPEDRWQHTPRASTIRYSLPCFKEIDPLVRRALEKQGRTLPTLDEYLQRNIQRLRDPISVLGVGAGKLNHGPEMPAAMPAPASMSVSAPKRRKITDFFVLATATDAPSKIQVARNSDPMDVDSVEPSMGFYNPELDLPVVDSELDRRLAEEVYRAQPSLYGEPGYEQVTARNGPYPASQNSHFQLDPDSHGSLFSDQTASEPYFNDEEWNHDEIFGSDMWKGY